MPSPLCITKPYPGVSDLITIQGTDIDVGDDLHLHKAIDPETSFLYSAPIHTHTQGSINDEGPTRFNSHSPQHG
ncbi:hypothetical protein RRG08_008844 [Elysia crispata]|uniref:Uncharacterized protein n=1 Tax=Elysia crispata TaxID=231223 RepID=A0AAE1ABA3_9GAST|nr:hypothetical protein RRG08_008844 [Elysia crispata]